MPLDAICLGAVTEELNTALAGCRIEKVYQPDRDEIVLQTRGQGRARRLRLSIAPGAPPAPLARNASALRPSPAECNQRVRCATGSSASLHAAGAFALVEQNASVSSASHS